ncbi:MAG: hypothetical protein IPJ71_18410 [Bdellovibrionales bacterium]|nr:hypothetical protein [Bdellovibrionales bacterium]
MTAIAMAKANGVAVLVTDSTKVCDEPGKTLKVSKIDEVIKNVEYVGFGGSETIRYGHNQMLCWSHFTQQAHDLESSAYIDQIIFASKTYQDAVTLVTGKPAMAPLESLIFVINQKKAFFWDLNLCPTNYWKRANSSPKYLSNNEMIVSYFGNLSPSISCTNDPTFSDLESAIKAQELFYASRGKSHLFPYQMKNSTFSAVKLGNNGTEVKNPFQSFIEFMASHMNCSDADKVLANMAKSPKGWDD